jgi:ubiquitin-protein ligase
LHSQQLGKHQIQNVYVVPSANSSLSKRLVFIKHFYCATKTYLVWYGVIFLHQGIYEGGIFRFTLFLPDNFPNESPVFK